MYIELPFFLPFFSSLCVCVGFMCSCVRSSATPSLALSSGCLLEEALDVDLAVLVLVRAAAAAEVLRFFCAVRLGDVGGVGGVPFAVGTQRHGRLVVAIVCLANNWFAVFLLLFLILLHVVALLLAGASGCGLPLPPLAFSRGDIHRRHIAVVVWVVRGGPV